MYTIWKFTNLGYIFVYFLYTDEFVKNLSEKQQILKALESTFLPNKANGCK